MQNVLKQRGVYPPKSYTYPFRLKQGLKVSIFSRNYKIFLGKGGVKTLKSYVYKLRLKSAWN